MDIVAKIKGEFGDADVRKEQSVVPARRIAEVLKFLRDNDDLKFDFLVDLTAVDYKGYIEKTASRFCVVYILYSNKLKSYYKIKAFLSDEGPEIDSATSLWKAADWAEREVYDMFGIKFNGHPNLKRILLPETFEEFPLRKEYPMKGKGERENFPKYYIPRET